MRRFVHILNTNELFGCLESDLMRFYRVDLRDLLRSPRKITIRQVVTWVRHLPPDSALARRGWAGETRPSLVENLMAAEVNELRRIRWMYNSAHSRHKVEEPPMVDLTPKEGKGG